MTTRLLITGGAGFIGSHFVEMAVEAGDTVAVLDALTYAGDTANLAAVRDRIAFHHGDIADGEAVAGLLASFAPDAVVNFAAETHVDNSISAPAAFMHTNITGTYTLLETARRYWEALPESARDAFRFVQVSTDEVYGALALGDPGRFTPESPLRPNSPYSASKAAGDMLCRAWHHTYGFPVIVTHCTNNYGPRQYPEKLIPVVIRCALKGKPLPLYGDGKHVRDWIHVRDHCAGVRLAWEKGRPGATYCFGGETEKDNRTLVETICAILDDLRPRADGLSYAEQITPVPDRPGHDRRYAVDNGVACETLGFTVQTAFEAGLRETVRWYVQGFCAGDRHAH